LFEFDYDCAWYAFFLNADEFIYGRYGGRDAKSDDGRLSMTGLKYAAETALAQHKAHGAKKPAARGKPVFVEQFPAAKARKRQDCIHCHQVNEFRRTDEKAAGTWSRDSLWVYPLPENVGLTLAVDRGDSIKSVRVNSPAAKVGMQTGDVLTRLNGYSVASFADAQYALHKGPKSGAIPVEWQRGSETMRANLEVADGWRKTNITWRSSLLDIMPSLPVSAEELTAGEKKALGLPENKAAFRQDKFVHSTLKAVGLQKDDVIVGLNGRGVDGTMDDFLGLVRREYLVSDVVALNIIRDGKPLAITLTLK
jgi:membrane-associated protease RseP (regulator of RpoE activity)